MQVTDFNLENDVTLSERFLIDGYVILPVENRDGLDEIRRLIAAAAGEFLQREPDVDTDPDTAADALLNGIHNHVDTDNLNSLRLAVAAKVRGTAWFRPTYYSLARTALSTLAGNELVMQRNLGLSVQLPHDSSSLLPIHCDVWDGDSPFEVVVWLPLVNCFETKSMYIVPPEWDRPFQQTMGDRQNDSAEDLFRAVEDNARFLEVPYGSVLLFSQTLMHGNRVNLTGQTRWSLNCRFKNLMAPFSDKKLGEFFEPITIRVATRMAMNYTLPEGFDE